MNLTPDLGVKKKISSSQGSSIGGPTTSVPAAPVSAGSSSADPITSQVFTPPYRAQTSPFNMATDGKINHRAGYDEWKSSLPKRLQYEGDYDLKGYYDKYGPSSIKGEAHLTDEFKLPNHPTFSTESKYFNDATRMQGGEWDGDKYIPFDVNRDALDEKTGQYIANPRNIGLNAFNPSNGKSSTPFNMAQESNPELYAKQQEGNQAISNRLNQLQGIYDAAQGQGASENVRRTVEQNYAPTPQLGVGESMGNSVSNFANRLKGTIPRLNIVATDVFENVLGKELSDKIYEFEGRDIDQVRSQAYSELEQLASEVKPTLGLVESIEKNSLSGVAAGMVNAITSLGSSAVPAIATGGASIFTEMTGDAIVDFNKAKADSLGKTVDELYASGEADFAIPSLIGATSGALEMIGLKGVGNLITKQIKGPALKKALVILGGGNKEGLTEFIQEGLTTANRALGEGKSMSEASEEAVDAMFSKQGLESYLQGVVGGAGVGGLGNLSSQVKDPVAKTTLNEELAKINMLEMDLQNPNVSDQTKAVLSNQVNGSISKIADVIEQSSEAESKIPKENLPRVNAVNNEIEQLNSVLNDPAVSPEVKTQVEAQIKPLEEELSELMTEPTSKKTTAPVEPVIAPLEEVTTPVVEEVIEAPVAEEVIVTPETNEETETVPVEEVVVEESLPQEGVQEVIAEPVGEVIVEEVAPIEETAPRTMDDVRADQKTIQDKYREILVNEGLFEQSQRSELSPETLADVRGRAEQETGLSIDALRAEADSFNTAPVAERPRTAAEKIRALKTKRNVAYDGLIGLPVAIYDGALETVATAIEAGTSIAEAIKKAVAYIKKNSNIQDDAFIENEINRSFEDAGILLKGLQQENPTPDIVEEIEQSPEEITQENIQAYRKQLEKTMSNAKTTSLIKSGVVRAELATDALKKVAEITDRKSMLAANRAVKKLFGDVIRNAYISQIKQAKGGLKTRMKGSKLLNTDLMKKFTGINESKLEIKDLEEYNSLVRMLNDQYNSRLDGVISDSELQKFVDKIADKTAAQTLKDQEVEEEVSEEVEGESESPTRRKLKAVTELNKATLRKGGYDPAYREVARALLDTDIENMSNSEIRKLNLAIINLAVNDRLVGHTPFFKNYIGNNGLQTLSTRIGDNIRGLLDSILGASLRSMDVNTKIVFKGVKDSALFQSLSGIAGISNGNSQVANIDMKGLESAYNSFVNNLKFPEFNTTENRFLRAMYSNVTQFSSIESREKDYNRYKSLIKQTSDKLLASTDAVEQREGQLIAQQYTEYLEPFETSLGFEQNFKAKQPKNAKVVDFFRDQFAKKLPEMKNSTLIYGGKNLREINNYLPISWKRYSGTATETQNDLDNIVEPVYDFDPETGDVSERQSSTTIERTNKSKISDSDRIVNMDFDRYIFDKYREMNYDIRTLKDRHQYNSIKDQEGFRTLVGGASNEKALTKGVVNMVKRQMGTRVNEKWQEVLKVSRVLSAKAVRQAIFGASQLIKQYPSVAMRTMINLNKDMDLFFKGVNIGMNNPIFDQFGVGLRSTTRGGTNYEMELNRIRKSDFSSSDSKLRNAANKVSKFASETLSKPLSYSDDAIAKHSWLSYYMKHVRDNGGDVNAIDWETEYQNPNMEAGAYADFMVSTTQNVNDNAKQADMLYDEGDVKTILRDVVIPFGSFARNAQANMEADLRTFSEGTPAEKKKAAWGILSTVAEQTAFNAIKVAIVANIVNNGANALLNALGGDDEDKKELGVEVDGSKIAKNTAADVLFGGMGQVASNIAVWGTNSAYKSMFGGSKDLFYRYNPAQFGEPDFGVAGIYGILPQTVYNMAQKGRYATGSVTEGYSNKGKEMESTSTLSNKDQALSVFLFLMDGLAVAGLSDAELSRMNQVMFRDIKKRNSPTSTFTVKGKNSNADVEVEEIDNE